MVNKNTSSERKLQIAYRDNLTFCKSCMYRAVAVIAALIVSALVIVLLTDYGPIKVYSSMFLGNFSTTRKIWSLAEGVAILLLISLAVTPAFKMKFWNIGAEGQALIGALSASACMIYLGDKLPGAIFFPVMFIVCVISGMIWGIIPAFFKAKYNTNETLFTLMMNYVATQLVAYFIVKWESPLGSNNVGTIANGCFPKLFGQAYMLNISIVILITAIVYVYLKYSKHGYEISVVGESENTARYIGINVKRVIIRTMALSGALCGLVGMLIVAGEDHTITTATIGGIGFTAIMVSWLAKFNPLYMTLTSFLIVFLERGSNEIATSLQLNRGISSIITGIIIFFIIGSEFFVKYKIQFNKPHKEGK